MRWATRDNLHLDRVACCWLIRRFLDPTGEIAFVPPERFDAIPAGTVTFGIPGGVFSPHDEHGTAFTKMLRHYRESVPAGALPALQAMAEVVDVGVKIAIGREDEIDCEPHARALGEALATLSEGFVFVSEGDEDNLTRSTSLYDALCAALAGEAILAEDPALGSLGLLTRLDAVKARLPRLGA